ncbi:MAG TPA: hypothetical protein VJG83_02995 [archaeon]|nr:hypothetical protein [archaeon]
MSALKVSEVWRKKFDRRVALFDISENDNFIIIYLNDFQVTGRNDINDLILLDKSGQIIKEIKLSFDFHISDLKIVDKKVVCIDRHSKRGYFEVYDISLNLKKSGIIRALPAPSKSTMSNIFVSGKDWYILHYPVADGKKSKLLICFKNGKKLWEKKLPLRDIRGHAQSSFDSKLVHLITETGKRENPYQLLAMEFEGKQLFAVQLPTNVEYPSFSSESLTIVGCDNYYPEPCPLYVFDNKGSLLFKKQLRIEPHDVFISRNDFIFVSLHSEYDGNVGGVVIYDKYGTLVSDINTMHFATKPVETRNGEAVAIPSGGEILIFAKNGKLSEKIKNIDCLSITAGKEHILAKNESFLTKNKQATSNELVLFKIE